MNAGTDVRVGRIYDQPTQDDGIRVLVDRRWPRGVSKVRADIDEWCSAVAPSDELRAWYGHAVSRFEEFGARYREELKEPERAHALAHLASVVARGRLTLLTATRDVETSQAAILHDLLTTGVPTDPAADVAGVRQPHRPLNDRPTPSMSPAGPPKMARRGPPEPDSIA